MSDEIEAHISENEIGEVVNDPIDGGEPSDDEGMNDEQVFEIDLSNNSSSYFDRHEDSVFVVTTHPTLPMVVTGGGDNMAYLWTTHKRPPVLVETLSGHTESVVAAGFSADGQYLVCGDMSGQIRVWRSQKGGEKWQFVTAVRELDEVTWLEFHPRLPLVAAGATDGSVWFFDLSNKFEVVAVSAGNGSPAAAGAFIDAGEDSSITLITLYEDGHIVSLDVYQNQLIWSLGRSELRGNHFWISISVSPSGRSIAAGAIDGTVAILKSDDGMVLQILKSDDDLNISGEEDVDRSVETLSWSDPRLGLFAIGTVSGKIAIYSTSNWRVRSQIDLREAITKIKFAQSAPRLAVSAHDGTMATYDALSGTKVWTGKGHNSGVLGFTDQNNFQRFITAGDDAVSLVFDVVEEPSELPVVGGAAL